MPGAGTTWALGGTGAGGGGETGVVGTGTSWAAVGSRGRSRRSSAPGLPGTGGSANRTVPPCSPATQRAIARPRPVPPALSSGEVSVPKRSKARSRSCGATPGPWSATSRRQRAAVAAYRTVTRPPSGPCRTAFSSDVGQQLAELAAVGRHLDAVRDLDVEGDAAAGRDQLGDDLVDEGQQGDGLGAQRRDAGLGPGQLEQVAEQGADALGLVDRTVEVLLVGRADPVGEVLEGGGERGERGAQLVGDGGDEVALLAVDGGQLGRHLVERAGQLADLVGPLGADPAAVVAARHPPRRLGHLAQRRGHPDREELGERERQGDGDGHREQDRYAGPLGHDADHGGDQHAGAHQQAELDLDRGDRPERLAHRGASSA